jgi:hypothetical protein
MDGTRSDLDARCRSAGPPPSRSPKISPAGRYSVVPDNPQSWHRSTARGGGCQFRHGEHLWVCWRTRAAIAIAPWRIHHVAFGEEVGAVPSRYPEGEVDVLDRL